MSLAVFPTLPGLTYTVVKSANFDTLVMRAPNAYEVRVQQTINPTWDFTLIYDFLHDFFWGSYTAVSELRTLMGFFSQMGGQAQSFPFTDPDDYNVGPALSTVSREFEVVIMVERAIGEMVGSDRVPPERLHANLCRR
jgi:quinol-cytochrome oxidoreductase complex cytochrome b subunit